MRSPEYFLHLSLFLLDKEVGKTYDYIAPLTGVTWRVFLDGGIKVAFSELSPRSVQKAFLISPSIANCLDLIGDGTDVPNQDSMFHWMCCNISRFL